MRQTLSLLVISVLVLFICSCSNGGTNPVFDISTNEKNTKDIFQDSLPIIDMTVISETAFNATGIFGAYDLMIDAETIGVELAAKRSSTIGESYIVNGISYFTISPCADCLKIKSFALTNDGFLQLTFAMKHPFQPGDVLKPPTAINRLDLDVFDVVLLVHPVDTTPDVFSLTGTSAYTGILVDNSGYSTELANVTGDSAALPYVLVVDDNIAGTDTFNKFQMGAESEFDAFFNINGSLNFELYLTMGYGASAKKPQRLDPTYYNPEFNKKSAWKVIVTPPNGDDIPVIGNTWNDSDNATAFDVTVEVFDWQIGANVNPELPNTDDIYAASGVGNVSLEIPGMNNSLVATTTEDSGSGTPIDPLVYTLSVANENYLAAGEYTGLVKVSDERLPGTVGVGGETDTLVDSPDGISINWVNIPEYATYQTFPATVVVGCGPITGSITNPVCPISGIATGSMIGFTALASSANGGDPIVLYEWDMDYDGVTFDIDDTGDSVTLGPFTNPNCGTPPEDPVTYTVAVRATDSCTPPNETIFDTCEVTVDICATPSIGNITIIVNRLGSFTVDESGPFTIAWDDPGPGYEEYALYVDTDPSDGLMSDFNPAGTTTTLSCTDTVTSFPSNHYIIGWTYIVRGRTEAGNQASEGPDSEPAHVMFNGWETLSYQSNPGIGNDGEGWMVNHESSYTSSGSFPRIYTSWVIHGSYEITFSPFCGNYATATAGRWNGITKETPTVPDSTVRFIDIPIKIFQTAYSNGAIIGTIATQPCQNFTNTTDFIWAQSENNSPFTGYNVESSDAYNTFGDLPSGQNNAWSYPGSAGNPYLRFGGDVNTNGHPEHNYVGIEFVRFDTSLMQPYLKADEVAILIY